MEHVDGFPIVLFTGREVGFVIVEDPDHEFMEKCERWIPCTDKSEWIPFTGTITLSND
jgi:hypothetical protein